MKTRTRTSHLIRFQNLEVLAVFAPKPESFQGFENNVADRVVARRQAERQALELAAARFSVEVQS